MTAAANKNALWGRRVAEADVRAVASPAFTETWKPFSHADMLDALAVATKELGLKVKEREYSMTANGLRMFGYWQIENGTEGERDFLLGFRGALDKHFAKGICCGAKIFVCSNLMFQGQFTVFRKHTGGLSYTELALIATEAIKTILPQFDELREWHEALKQTGLDRDQSALLIVAAMRRGLIPPSRYNDFHELFLARDGRYQNDHTLHGFHAAVTEMYNDNSLLTVQYKNAGLNKFINYEAPRLLQEGVDFEVAAAAADSLALEAKETQRDFAKESGSIRQRVQKQLREAARGAKNATVQ